MSRSWSRPRSGAALLVASGLCLGLGVTLAIWGGWVASPWMEAMPWLGVGLLGMGVGLYEQLHPRRRRQRKRIRQRAALNAYQLFAMYEAELRNRVRRCVQRSHMDANLDAPTVRFADELDLRFQPCELYVEDDDLFALIPAYEQRRGGTIRAMDTGWQPCLLLAYWSSPRWRATGWILPADPQRAKATWRNIRETQSKDFVQLLHEMGEHKLADTIEARAMPAPPPMQTTSAPTA